MSEILEKLRGHHRARLDGPMASYTIPEIGETVYWRPLNLKQQNRIYQYQRKGSLEGLAEAVIVRCLDKDGNRLFKDIDKTELMNMVDPGVINRIVEAMGEDEDLEDLEKN